MKKRLCLAVAISVIALFSTAQTPQETDVLTTLCVNVTVERQEIVAGPYARYAQKYLGVAAPLADKVIHEVTGVDMMYNSEMSHHPQLVENRIPSHMDPEGGFPRLTVDKTSAIAISLEESARLAAEKIFEIRRSRFDLITGEIGENVFGGGLSAALSELSRLEEEYLSLFLGKQTISTGEKQFRVTPIKDKATYTVCRFSDTDGLLPGDDLSGVPMVLELKPTDDSTTAQTPESQARSSSRAVPVVIPAIMQCRIILDGSEFASEVFTIRQLSRTVYIDR